MSTEYALPAESLRPYVQFYARRRFDVAHPVLVHAVPSRGAPMLEFSFGTPIHVRYVGHTNEERSPDIVLVGLLTRPHSVLRLDGAVRSFVIMFRPTGLSRLFGLPLHELTDTTVDATVALGAVLTDWRDRFAECASFESCIQTADALLHERLRRGDRDDMTLRLVERLDQQNGVVRIDGFAHEAGMTPRTLERQFLQRLAISPKRYARIVRFQAALDYKARRPTLPWSAVAPQFGYHDQMHLVRDFREFTGDSPTAALQGLVAHFREQLIAWRASPGGKARVVPRCIV